MSFIKLLQEARKAEEKPSKGLSKKQKSAVAKKARAGKDIGKKGKGFEKVAAKAAKQYGSEEAGKRVAAAAMWKNIKREGYDNVREGLHEDILRELGLFLGQASVSAAIASTLGFSWAKSLLAIPEFKEKWKNANTKESKIELIKKYLTYVANPTNIGKYTQSNKLDEGEESDDHEVSMAASSLRSIINSAYMLMEKLGKEERNIPGWIQDHITNAENYIDQAAQGFHELGGDGPNSGSMGKCMDC